MKLPKIILVLAAAALLFAQADATLQKAIRKETVEGDLKGAIELYQKAISQAGKDRPTAAQAWLRLGECFEKQGDKQARQAYERLVKDFGDSKEASQARVRLVVLGGGRSGLSYRQIWAGPKVDTSGTVSPDAHCSIRSLFD